MSEDITYAVRAELFQAPENTYLTGLLERMHIENPQLTAFICNYAAHTPDPARTANLGLFVYRLLESQAAADRMKEEFPI